MEKNLKSWMLLSPLMLAGGQIAGVEAVLAQERPNPEFVDWLAQTEPFPIQITGIQLEETDAGLRIVLATAEGELPSPTTTVSRNALVVEIPNASLALAEGDEFLEFEPAEEIALVQVTELPGNRVQVVVTGIDAAPTAELSATASGLALSVEPGTARATEPNEALRVVVTGEEEGDYVEPNATTATRTDTPLIEIPQSIQVIPEAILEYQQVIRLNDALRNLPGVVQSNTFGGGRENFAIRGFEDASILRNGFRVGGEGNDGLLDTANIQQIEVLRGPASVLYGSVEPGGVINLVTKSPLETPFGEFTTQFGGNGLVRPTLDVTGPINESGSIRYRLNAAYERADGYRNFETEVDRVFFAPVVALDLGDRTDLTVEFDYFNDQRPFDRGIPPLGDEIPDVPRTTNIGEPTDFIRTQNTGVGYRLEHRFSDSWRLRNRFRYADTNFLNRRAELSEALGGLDPETGEIQRLFWFNDSGVESYEAQTEVIGQFATGSINHTLLIGVDVFFDDSRTDVSIEPTQSVNLFNPQTGLVPSPDLPLAIATTDTDVNRRRIGLLLQDQIELLPRLNLLLGGRVDFFNQRSASGPISIPGQPRTPGREAEQSRTAFTPRVGLVYQPWEPLAVYTSYSRSFQPNVLDRTTVAGELLEPTEGEQFEVGVKANLLDGRLAATLAFFDISKTNIAADDPNNPTFVVPIGEQSSRGIELDVTGEILPGWNFLAGVSLLDAEIESSPSPNIPEGGTPRNVPDTSASLWTTYEIRSGRLSGLGFGLGLYYVGERQGDNANTFTLDDYLRTDAAIYYSRDDIRLGLNFRNLFDITYFENGTLARRGAVPGEPFTVIGSLAMTF